MIPVRIESKYLIFTIMNEMKYYLLLSFWGIALGCYAQPTTSRDTLCLAQKEIKTFKVRKVDAAIGPQLLSEPKETEVAAISYIPVTEKEETVQLPSLAYDEKGLMQLMHLAPFVENGRIPTDTKYVVFSFAVDDKGAVSDIRVFNTNDRRMVDVLVHKLSGTIWNPARTNTGDFTHHDFGKWIAAVPTNINEHDYEKHRY
mgnify:CR=1 FL=1